MRTAWHEIELHVEGQHSGQQRVCSLLSTLNAGSPCDARCRAPSLLLPSHNVDHPAGCPLCLESNPNPNHSLQGIVSVSATLRDVPCVHCVGNPSFTASLPLYRAPAPPVKTLSGLPLATAAFHTSLHPPPKQNMCFAVAATFSLLVAACTAPEAVLPPAGRRPPVGTSPYHRPVWPAWQP